MAARASVEVHSWRDVQWHRQESANQAQSVAGQQVPHSSRVRAEIAGRTKLGHGQPEFPYLAEHGVRGELVSPARRLTDAPRDAPAMRPASMLGIYWPLSVQGDLGSYRGGGSVGRTAARGGDRLVCG
jgi:hypothetical protein